MFRALGWAAFLAFSTSLYSQPAGATGGRPTFACFSPENAAAIGRLGANDQSVRYGFETGECLALRPSAMLSGVERVGNVWRFRAFGAAPYLYAAAWGAGFDPAAPAAPPGYEQYLPVTDKLLAISRLYASCYDANERLARRFDDHERRWKAYVKRSRVDPNGASPVVVKHISPEGPMLQREASDIRKEARHLEEHCRAVEAVETDDDFVAFMRSAQV
jgi:hypothetical protein